MTYCPMCAHRVCADARACPNCGHDVGADARYHKWTIWAIVLVIGFVIVQFVCSMLNMLTHQILGY